MPRLIVNADDFGLTSGVNRAVAECNRAGALTSATLMACSHQAAAAMALAKQLPSLGVGCHVVLLDGVPAAPPERIASLLAPAATPGEAPQFRRTLSTFVRDLALGRILPIHIEREATAQISRLQHAGLRPTHVDTHKHTHMFPAVLAAVCRATAACGVPAIRNPFEPAWSQRRTPNAPLVRRLEVRALGSLQRNFAATVRRHGLRTTSGSLGVLATGSLDAVTLQSILGRLPDGTWELVCHPAYVDDALYAVNTRLTASRQVELESLRTLPGWLPPEIVLIHYGQLGG
jgi:predicted glycoside hydrolase/deacetylase ChbG (UPF0249 family)